MQKKLHVISSWLIKLAHLNSLLFFTLASLTISTLSSQELVNIENFSVSNTESRELTPSQSLDSYPSSNTSFDPNQMYRFNVARTAGVTDTIQYNFAKASGLEALSINNATSALAAAQYFDAPGEIQIAGMDFYAYKSDLNGGSTIDVSVELYLASNDSIPSGAPLATTTVTLDQFGSATTLFDLRYRAEFTTPVAVSAPYVMVLRNDSPNNIVLYSNDFGASDGGEEWLSSLQIGANWLRSYDVSIGGTTYDADFFLEPYVAYDLTADFELSPEANSGNNMVDVSSNSSTDVFLENRMYNFNAAISQSEDSYEFDFNDGTVLNGSDNSHTFANSDPQEIDLTVTLNGWTATYTDEVTKQWSQVLSLDELSLSEAILVPNPAGDYVELRNLPTSSLTNIEVYNVLGAKILETSSFYINTQDWNSGLYLVKIYTENSSVTKRLIKQ